MFNCFRGLVGFRLCVCLFGSSSVSLLVCVFVCLISCSFLLVCSCVRLFACLIVFECLVACSFVFMVRLGLWLSFG